MAGSGRRWHLRTSLLPAMVVVLAGATAVPTWATVLPDGFAESIVFSGLTGPTAVRFAPDGRIFIAEKSGIVKVFDSLSDTTPKIFADLRTNTHNFWDRGLLGLALHPNFPSTPYVYVLYTLDAAIGGTPPRWGSFGGTQDGCPNPPGATANGCVVAGRLSRLQASGDAMVGTEEVLLENWCQQFPSHSIGTLVFGADGALYVSAGEGSNFLTPDWGQFGYPQVNPCGDPPGGVGGVQTPPDAAGGALRSQHAETSSANVTLNGTILRLDPDTGAAFPGNPLAGVNDRIIAYGLRNPFRIAPRPGTNEIWISDVGWEDWEEVDRIGDVTDGIVENFGWPCYEGVGRQPGYEAAGLGICQGLYGRPGAVTDPFFTYDDEDPVVSGEPCSTATGTSITGLTFYSGGSYPAAYGGTLFFADYNRGCIWTMPQGPSGDPDPTARAVFASGAGGPVDLQIGPGGDLFYVDFTGGTLRRITYPSADQAPVAVIQASATNGPTPLVVQLDGSA